MVPMFAMIAALKAYPAGFRTLWVFTEVVFCSAIIANIGTIGTFHSLASLGCPCRFAFFGYLKL
jgi:hypothetical protein